LQENSSCEDYEDLEVTMDEIYRTYPIITANDRAIPSFPHPTIEDKFILLTPGAVGTWGRELVSFPML
jgi:hypothetical protein